MSDVVEKTLTALPSLLSLDSQPGSAKLSSASKLGHLIRGITDLSSKHVSLFVENTGGHETGRKHTGEVAARYLVPCHRCVGKLVVSFSLENHSWGRPVLQTHHRHHLSVSGYIDISQIQSQNKNADWCFELLHTVDVWAATLQKKKTTQQTLKTKTFLLNHSTMCFLPSGGGKTHSG